MKSQKREQHNAAQHSILQCKSIDAIICIEGYYCHAGGINSSEMLLQGVLLLY
jgi:hypothetical protein